MLIRTRWSPWATDPSGPPPVGVGDEPRAVAFLYGGMINRIGFVLHRAALLSRPHHERMLDLRPAVVGLTGATPPDLVGESVRTEVVALAYALWDEENGLPVQEAMADEFADFRELHPDLDEVGAAEGYVRNVLAGWNERLAAIRDRLRGCFPADAIEYFDLGEHTDRVVRPVAVRPIAEPTVPSDTSSREGRLYAAVTPRWGESGAADRRDDLETVAALRGLVDRLIPGGLPSLSDNFRDTGLPRSADRMSFHGETVRTIVRRLIPCDPDHAGAGQTEVRRFASASDAKAVGYDPTTGKVVGVIEEHYKGFFAHCDAVHKPKSAPRLRSGIRGPEAGPVKVGREYLLQAVRRGGIRAGGQAMKRRRE